MDIGKVRICLILSVLLVYQCGRVQCGEPSDRSLERITEFFAKYYKSSCVLLLYTKEEFHRNRHEIHRTIYHLGNQLSGFRVAVSQTQLFYGTFWLLFLDSSLQDFFQDIRTPFNLRLVVASVKSKNHTDFSEVYRVLPDRPLRTPHFGSWTRRGGFQVESKDIHNRRHNLEGIVLRTGSTDRRPNGEPELKGYFPEVWRELERLLNFSSIHYLSIDNVTGIADEKGTWNGLVGMLQRNEIDVAVSGFILEVQRSHVIDFTRPLLRSSHQIFFRYVGNYLNWDSILGPFTKSIWLTIMLWVVFSSLFSGLCHALAHDYCLERNTKREEFSVINSGFFFVKALCNQGHHAVPSVTATRIIFLSAYVVAGVLVPSYSAALIYFITSKSPVRPFDSLQELLQLGTYKLQTLSKTSHYTYFSNSSNPLLHKIYSKLMKKIPDEQLPFSMSEGLEKVCNQPNVAHFGDMANALTFVNEINARDGNCKIMYLSKEISSAYFSMGLTRNSPFKPVIDHFLHKMIDGGVIPAIRMKTLMVKKNIREPRMWTVVESKDTLQIFVILSSGMVLSMLIFAAEVLFAKCIRLRTSKASRKTTQVLHLQKVQRNISLNK